jgi:hypothetical protein
MRSVWEINKRPPCNLMSSELLHHLAGNNHYETHWGDVN